MQEGLFTLLGAALGALISGVIGFLQQKYTTNRMAVADMRKQQQNMLKQIMESLISIAQIQSDRLDAEDAKYLQTALDKFSYFKNFYQKNQGEFYLLFDKEYRNEINTLYTFTEEQLKAGTFAEESEGIIQSANKLIEKTKDEFNEI